MVNILVIDNNEDGLIKINSYLKTIKNTYLDSSISWEKAIALSDEKKIELVFININYEDKAISSLVQEFKKRNSKVFIVAFSHKGISEYKNEAILAGVEDYISTELGELLFKARVENYVKLTLLREEKLYNKENVNLFSSEVANRNFSFNIFNEKSLSEMWDFFMMNDYFKAEGLLDCIKIFYAICEFGVEQGQETKIVLEDSYENIYLSVMPIDYIPARVLLRVMKNHYEEGMYKLGDDILSFKLKMFKDIKESTAVPSKKEEMSEDDKKVLRASHTHKINATEFLETTPINFIDNIEILEEIEDRIDIDILNFADNQEPAYLKELSKHLQEYFLIIENLIEFEHLSYAINKLSIFLDGLDPAIFDEEKIKRLSLLLITILQDLTEWRRAIFVDASAEDIHYLDSSLMNSFLQVEMVFDAPSEDDDDDDDFELF